MNKKNSSNYHTAKVYTEINEKGMQDKLGDSIGCTRVVGELTVVG